jgi:hypothetical protein
MDIRSGRPCVIHSANIFVDRNQLIYCADRNAGFYITELTN